MLPLKQLFYACFAEINGLFSPAGHFVSRKSLSLRQAARNQYLGDPQAKILLAAHNLIFAGFGVRHVFYRIFLHPGNAQAGLNLDGYL